MSINIEGARYNIEYLKTLAEQCDILCIQEHWLHEFECENFFETNFPNMKFTVKCAESEVLFQRTVNKHGVAILWKQYLNPYVKKLDDGNDKIIGITLQNKQDQYCIFNIYGPTQGKAGANKMLLHSFKLDP